MITVSSKVPLWYLRHNRTTRQLRSRSPPSAAATARLLLSRYLCVAAVTLAFAGGIAVGVLLPLYAPTSSPVLWMPSDAATASVERTSWSGGRHRLATGLTLEEKDRRLRYSAAAAALLIAANDPGKVLLRGEAPHGGSPPPPPPGSSREPVSLSAAARQVQSHDELATMTSAISSRTSLNRPESESKRLGADDDDNEIALLTSSDRAWLLQRLLAIRQQRQWRRLQSKSPLGRVEPILGVSTTMGWPQIIMRQPYPLTTSTPRSWSHGGGPRTILRSGGGGRQAAAAPQQQMPQLHDGSAARASHSAGALTPVTLSLELRAAAAGNNGPLPSATRHNKTVLETWVADGVFWSDRVEAMLPSGFKQRDTDEWTHFSSRSHVVKVAEGCGRMQNRLLVFDNGTKSCCRYRQNNDQIQGEIFSFYLARLLGLENLPPASLGLLHGRDWQWALVRGQLTLAQWNEQKPVVMTKFVDHLEPAYIPRHFRGDGPQEWRRLHPVEADLEGVGREQLVELAQWSDLIVFDYLTANLDRVVNNMYNRQWNPDMMKAPAHNLARETRTGLLVFLDNESGLLHGYRLLDKYEGYHRAMLQALCIFRRATAQAVRTLAADSDLGPKLWGALHNSQPYMAEWLPSLPDKSIKILRERLARVVQQIDECKRRYASVPGLGSNEDVMPSTVELYVGLAVTPSSSTNSMN